MVTGRIGLSGVPALPHAVEAQDPGQENVMLLHRIMRATIVKEMILSYKPATLIHVQVNL